MSIQGYAEGISAKLLKAKKVIEAADIILEEKRQTFRYGRQYSMFISS